MKPGLRNMRLSTITWLIALWINWLPTLHSLSLPPIFWNKTNTMFKSSNNDHIIDVTLGDEIDFVCPFSTIRNDVTSEYYIIYQVSKSEYSQCRLDKNRGSRVMIVNCSNPMQRKTFTILFEAFSAIPTSLQFSPGQTYYYITTSSGVEEGLQLYYLGACHYHNMKLTIRVNGPTTATSIPAATSASSQLDIISPTHPTDATTTTTTPPPWEWFPGGHRTTTSKQDNNLFPDVSPRPSSGNTIYLESTKPPRDETMPSDDHRHNDVLAQKRDISSSAHSIQMSTINSWLPFSTCVAIWGMSPFSAR